MSKKLEIITGETETEFAEKVNAILEEHEEAVVSFPEPLKAYVVYKPIPKERTDEYWAEQFRKEKPVTAEFKDAGVQYLCEDCPHLEIGDDKRRKWWPCKYASYGRSRTDSGACEAFYVELKNHEIKLRGEE